MQHKKNKNISRIFKLQLWITAIFFLTYIILVLIGGKDVFSTDLGNKKRVAGATVGAVLRIFGPPEKPTIIGNSSCSAKGSSAISLRWKSVVDATSYDIYRDNEELIGDLTDNFFTDENVSGDKSYSYYVVAKGPAGSAISDTRVFLAKICRPATLPFVKISLFEGKDFSQINKIPTTTSKRPIFYGQTDILFAEIELEVHSSKAVVYSTIRANANGSWQWSFPVELPSELHTIYAKVIDPISGEMLAQTAMQFIIIDKENEEDDENKRGHNNESEKESSLYQEKFTDSTKEVSERPFDLGISLENKAHIRGVSVAGEAYRGESIQAILEFDGVSSSELFDIEYLLIDPDKHIIARYQEQSFLNDDLILEKVIPLADSLKLGKYRLEVRVKINNVVISNEVYFILKDKPILKIGVSSYITYLDLVNNFSWLFIISASFLSFFSLLILREHYLYKKALIHITEKVLRRKGFIN